MPSPSRLGSNGVGIPFGVPVPPSPLNSHLGYLFFGYVPSPVSSAFQSAQPSFDQSPLSKLSPVERSQTLHHRKRTMHPYLQFMCGPLLRYDTIDADGVWRGAAMIVSKS